MMAATWIRCVECGREFDLLDEDDAVEWSFGHECEAKEVHAYDVTVRYGEGCSTGPKRVRAFGFRDAALVAARLVQREGCPDPTENMFAAMSALCQVEGRGGRVRRFRVELQPAYAR